MIHQKPILAKQILTGFLSILTLTPCSSMHADWDWKDVAACGLIAAGAGACIYAATRPEDPQKIKRDAELLYQQISNSNRSILQAYRTPHQPSDSLINLVTHKGRTYQADQWFISDNNFLSDECRHHAPLLRGYAALLRESEQLLEHRQKLIDCFGSVYAARHEYYNFENLENLASRLQAITHALERLNIFMVTRNNFAMYRSAMEEHARTQRELAAMRAEARMLRARGRYDYSDLYIRPYNTGHCQFNLSFYN